MPIYYSFDGNLFCVDLVGSYTTRDMMEAFLAAVADPLFPEDARFLLDVRQSISLKDRRPADMRAIAEFFVQHAHLVGGRLAIVAELAVHYGLGRMGAAFAELGGAEVEVFMDVDEAKAWLGVMDN